MCNFFVDLQSTGCLCTMGCKYLSCINMCHLICPVRRVAQWAIHLMLKLESSDQQDEQKAIQTVTSLSLPSQETCLLTTCFQRVCLLDRLLRSMCFSLLYKIHLFLPKLLVIIVFYYSNRNKSRTPSIVKVFLL